MPNIPLHINLDVLRGRLSTQLDGNLTSLETVIESINNGAYAANGFSTIGILKMTLSSPSPDVFKKQEINKCFKSSLSALQDFMDGLIAMKRMSASPIIMTKPVSSDEEIQAFIKETEERFIQEVSQDRKLKVPDKLEELNITELTIRAIVDGYFLIRNSLEHHKGLADRDITLIYREMTLVSGETEIDKLPFHTKENAGINLITRDISRIIPKNAQIEISELEMKNVINTIKVFVSIYSAQKVSDMINQPNPPTTPDTTPSA